MQRTSSWIDLQNLIPFLLVLFGAGAILFTLLVNPLGFGTQPGIGPNQVSLAIGGLGVLIAGLYLRTKAEPQPILDWLFLLASVVACTFAADLLIIGGLPGNLAKWIALGGVGAAAVGARLDKPILAPNQSIQDWFFQLSLDWDQIRRFSVIVLQLILVVAVLDLFKIENQAFYHNLALLIFFGFLLHYLVPSRLQLPFFLLLSVAAILGIFGAASGLWIVLLGLGLIGLCHLPVGLPLRVILLLAAGIGLAAARMDLFTTPIPQVIWPIFGSLFMFRLIIYMYDVKNKKSGSFDFISSSAYFFMLPNLVFPLFPTVDYTAFRRTYFDDEQYKIFQVGIRWILRGIAQLIAYRFVNYYLVTSPESVANFGDLTRFLYSNILLLARITGQFHIAVGILHLFGFNLPLTNKNHFLATSFTDFWRRASIYWKDFQLKVFYYPVYFTFRGLNDTLRLVIATAVAFAATWFLHAYQWFWLRGTFLIALPDILFWSIFGMVVLLNSLYEVRKGRARSLGTKKWSFRSTAAQALQAFVLFSLITVLWGLWTSPSVGEYLSLLSVAIRPLDGLGALLPLAIVFLAVVAAKFWFSWVGEENSPRYRPWSRYTSEGALTSIALLGIFLMGSPALYARLNQPVADVLADLTVSRLSSRDADLLLQGYYEDLAGVDRFNVDLWNVYTKRPSDWPLIHETEAARISDSFAWIELNPEVSINFHGATFTTNQWGMRDKDYSLVPPEGAYRIALLGPSFVMGSGVEDYQTFDWLLEERLNDEATGAEIDSFEILNFGVSGQALIQELYMLDTEALNFQPDAVFLVAHQEELRVVVRNLADRLISGGEIPYSFMRDFGERAGVEVGMPQGEAERRLEPLKGEIALATYREIVRIANENDLQALWIYMPTPEDNFSEEEVFQLHQLAEQAGFTTVSLRDLFDGQDLGTMIVAEWDKHPNAAAHLLIADRLYEELIQFNGNGPFWQLNSAD